MDTVWFRRIAAANARFLQERSSRVWATCRDSIVFSDKKRRLHKQHKKRERVLSYRFCAEPYVNDFEIQSEANARSERDKNTAFSPAGGIHSLIKQFRLFGCGVKIDPHDLYYIEQKFVCQEGLENLFVLLFCVAV